MFLFTFNAAWKLVYCVSLDYDICIGRENMDLVIELSKTRENQNDLFFFFDKGKLY
jgi:hypothetical protein